MPISIVKAAHPFVTAHLGSRVKTPDSDSGNFPGKDVAAIMSQTLREDPMEISSASSGLAVTKAAESSIMVAKKALDAQKLEGRAAVDLIQQARVGVGGERGNTLDIYV